MPKMKNWSVVSDPYQAPEIREHRLAGEVYGHPLFPDGYSVTTSEIVKTEGRTVTTKSGTLYELENAHPDYEKYVREVLKREIDPNNPVKILRD